MVRWIRPTLDTKFHIDFDWWEQNRRDLRVYLHQNLCQECRKKYPTHHGLETVDWIDPETAEVYPVDGLWQALRTHCQNQDNYIVDEIPLTNAIFKIFLANGNTPLTAVELGVRINKMPEKLLRVIGRGRVYDGIKPILQRRKRND